MCAMTARIAVAHRRRPGEDRVDVALQVDAPVRRCGLVWKRSRGLIPKCENPTPRRGTETCMTEIDAAVDHAYQSIQATHRRHEVVCEECAARLKRCRELWLQLAWDF